MTKIVISGLYSIDLFSKELESEEQKEAIMQTYVDSFHRLKWDEFKKQGTHNSVFVVVDDSREKNYYLAGQYEHRFKNNTHYISNILVKEISLNQYLDIYNEYEKSEKSEKQN